MEFDVCGLIHCFVLFCVVLCCVGVCARVCFNVECPRVYTYMLNARTRTRMIHINYMPYIYMITYECDVHVIIITYSAS